MATTESSRFDLLLLPGERWWGGAVADGKAMPFGSSPHRRNLATSAGFIDDDTGGGNQSAPLLVSNRGRYVWSDDPFEFAFNGSGGFRGVGSQILSSHGASTLAGAFRAASAAHFPPAGRMPAPALLTAPQYNTWIEMPYHPTQAAVVAYVRGLLDHGFPPGVVMVDDLWSVDYGDWRYDRAKFPDPVGMAAQLHDMDCTLMLWLVPFVSPDSETFRKLHSRGWLVRRPDGEPAVRRWWNGYSSILDLTHPDAVGWLRTQLGSLISNFGVDGFKFDAGDVRDYRPDDVTAAGNGAVGQCEAWARLGVQYPFNEFRACWKMGGQPLAQRLHDKPPIWGPEGLGSIIPEGIAQGLIGHPYICPDMIGGGDLIALTDAGVDQQLFVRYAQCAALFPMMQFSMAPWRVLDEPHLAAVHAAVDLHQSLVPEILQLADHAAATGDPILRPLAYSFSGYDRVADQFLLGDGILCAPVLERDARTRRVILPPGGWQDASGEITQGPAELVVDVGLESIPWWRLVTEATAKKPALADAPASSAAED
jgi:alpha-glucosidase (family GH31 glycosyl hydrolase)